MTLLIAGLALWVLIHMMPAATTAWRQALVESAGAKTYRAVFALLITLGLVLIVLGWRSTEPVAVYVPPAWGRDVSLFLMFLSVLLFGASHAKTNVKRLIRHPQLTAVIVWSIAHLLANGDSRSLVLFGTLGVWALIEILLINRRDGTWTPPPPASRRSELIAAAVTVVVFIVLIAVHPWIAGVPLLHID